MNFPISAFSSNLKIAQNFDDIKLDIEKIIQNPNNQNIEILDAICGRINSQDLKLSEKEKIFLKSQILKILEIYFSKNCEKKLDLQNILNFYSKQIKNGKKMELDIEQIIIFLKS